MKRAAIPFLLIILMTAVCTIVHAQRRVTPVEPAEELKIVTKEELKEMQARIKAAQHYADSLAKDSIENDSLRNANKIIRPTLMSAAFGLNVWDPLMRAFGQSHGGGEIWAALNLKNRFIPIVEMGIGSANSTPEESNFTYKTNPSFYGKIGMNYNFMYNKDPKYQLYAGVRAAWSAFKYDITGVAVDNGYWGNSHKFDILNQSSHAFWGELVFGIQVGLFRNFAMGWSFRYRFLFDIKDNHHSRPWHIPGYGSRENPIGASLSLIYNLPFGKKEEVKNVLEDGNEPTPEALPENQTQQITPDSISANKHTPVPNIQTEKGSTAN